MLLDLCSESERWEPAWSPCAAGQREQEVRLRRW